MGQTAMRFLLDSGAAVSVVRCDMLADCWRKDIVPVTGEQNTVAADGLPLDVIGRVVVPVSLGQFNADQEFIVVERLSVECILGADFLVKHGAVIDCRAGTLALGHQPRLVVPISTSPNRISNVKAQTPDEMMVSLPETLEVQGRSVMLIIAHLDAAYTQAGIVEPLTATRTGVPKNILVARTLTGVSSKQELVVEVTNTSPTPTRIHKGTKLATFIPLHQVCVIDSVQENTSVSAECGQEPPKVDLTGTNLLPEEQSELLHLLATYSNLFVSDKEQLGRTSVVKHSIETSGYPIRQPVRRLPESTRGAVDQEVQKMLKQGVIRPSTSPWSSPVVLVRKKDGSWRFCVDYRKVNSVTHRDAYPLPRIDATLDSLAGSKFFTTLDLASGYWQVELDEEAKEKTAFSIPSGHFEFNVMPFGLTNAPATFQRLMQCVLAGLTPSECLIYLDDIIVFGKSFTEHLHRLEAVFQCLNKAGLKLKPEKCYFARNEVQYLGHIVTADGIKPNPSKTEAVSSYPVPMNVRELRQFLGLTNYYRRFVEGYSKIAEPLHQLTRKTSKGYVWTPNCQNAFDELKYRLTTPPILAYPDFSDEFILHTDASATALGGVLCQSKNGQEHVIAYWSRQLTKPERNYSTIEREALAVVAAVKEFYPYLYGSHFTLFTDHNPLTALKGLKDVSGRIGRWMLFLQQFDFEIKYKPGRVHGDADALSRTPVRSASDEAGDGVGGDGDDDGGEGSGGDGYDGGVGSGGDGDDGGEECGGDRNGGASSGDSGSDIAVAILQPIFISHEDIRSAQHEDKDLKPLLDGLMNGNIPRNIQPGLRKCFIVDGILCRKFIQNGVTHHTQIVVPSKLRGKVLQQLHDCSGHLGLKKTLGKLKERFYWPGYEGDTEFHIQECKQCQRRNPPNPQPQAPMGTIKATQPFEKLSWDIMGPLPATNQGHKYILVVTDLFTKWVEAFPLRDTTSATLAKVLVDEIISRYGVPAYLHSDQGANLCSELIKTICKLLGVERTRTSAYHPQGNGQVERFNRTLESMLAKVVNENQKNWDTCLQKVLFAYRTSIHDTTGFTPFHLVFGRTPNLPVDLMLGRFDQDELPEYPDFVQDLHGKLKESFSIANKRLSDANARQKKAYDKRCHGVDFKVGDRVWLYVPAVKPGKTKKLSSLWRGPYTVLDRTSPVNYKIQLIGGTACLIVHRNRLKPCYGEPSHIRVTNAKPQTQEATLPDQPHNPARPRSYRDALMSTPSPPGGFTSSDPDSSELPSPISSDTPPADSLSHSRPIRNRQQPDRYGVYVGH